MSWSDMQCADFAPRQGRVEMSPGSTKVGGAGCRSPQFDILCTYGQTKEEDGGDPPGPTSHLKVVRPGWGCSQVCHDVQVAYPMQVMAKMCPALIFTAQMARPWQWYWSD